MFDNGSALDSLRSGQGALYIPWGDVARLTSAPVSHAETVWVVTVASGGAVMFRGLVRPAAPFARLAARV